MGGEPDWASDASPKYHLQLRHRAFRKREVSPRPADANTVSSAGLLAEWAAGYLTARG